MERSNFAFLRFLDQESDTEEQPSPPTRLSVLEPPAPQVGPGNILRLPDGIIHEILWGLGIEGIARFRCLSKTCKRLTESVRRLSINSQEIGDHPTERELFHEFLTSYFRRTLYVKSFEVSWVFKEGNSRNELEYIVQWLQEAIKRRVEYIRINFQPRKELRVLTQQVHESISIDSLCRHLSTRFGFIEVLSLNSVALLEESILNFGHLIGSCTSLRRLKLVNIRGIKSLMFTSNSLEELFLENFGDGSLCQIFVPEAKNLKKLVVCLNSYDDNESHLFVLATQLSTLSLNGDIRVDLGDLSKLESAFLYWKEDPYRRSQNKKLLDIRVAAVLRSACRARFLVTGELFLQSLKDREELAIGKFNHAEDVIVYVSPSRGFQFYPIAIFLLRFPNLSRLFLRSRRRTGDRGGRGGVDWKDHGVVQVIQQLEVIKIQIFKRIRIDEIIKYFLWRSRAMKKLTITFPT
ncbi:hypothetical protein K2173_016016 [Erythroxylum novogranatense]|uniref:F-box domain-containing protein n=1 Tax=Erythroxylum novogranatense TaxID=1862640 RepID=A0AAV8SF78_9ROSI|nr:hypothetical protein K2173_016016 [Erythroxylum novogranatense]